MATIQEALQTASQYQRSNRLLQAEQTYRMILKNHPYQPDALHGLGVLANQAGQFQQAEKLFKRALEFQPDLVKGWFSLGNLLQVQGQLSEATECYQSVLKLQPKLVAVHNNLGYVLQQQNRLEEAIESYQMALKLDPDCSEVLVNLANILYEKGQLSFRQQAEYAILNNNLGVQTRQKTGDLKTAITYYQQAIQLQPELGMTHYNLGIALEEQGKLARAIQQYQTALNLPWIEQDTHRTAIHQKLCWLERKCHPTLKSDRLKLAFICQPFVMTVFPQPIDSIGILTEELVRRLSIDCEVTVYAPGAETHGVIYHGVRYQYIAVARDQKDLKTTQKPAELNSTWQPEFAASTYYQYYISQVAQDLQRRECNIVHLHNLSQFIPTIRRWNPQAKIVLHMHCEWLTQLNYESLEKWLRDADLILSPSAYIADGIRQRFPQLVERCQVIYNGVNSDRLLSGLVPILKDSEKFEKSKNSGNSGKRLLYVGRVSPEKGNHILLEAFRQVLAKYPDTKLDVVGPINALPHKYLVALSSDPKVAELAIFYGEKDWQAHLKQQVAELNPLSHSGNAVSFWGGVPPARIASFYHQADLFVFPSVCHEAFGMPIAEAMVAGLPVLATAGGAFPELVESGKTGMLVERGNATALAQAILELLAHEDCLAEMGRQGCQRAIAVFF
ncbi:MAG: glycosyltransferase [Oscillatoriales cyanobacterium SM2_3_0]|nr:glycosyltransferase [Oscillatoriales cyanobacterium SM2_3_0]